MPTDLPSADFHLYTATRSAVRERMATAFGDAAAAVRTVLYPCSSADIFTPYLLFPDADRYILLDRQPAMKTSRWRERRLEGLPTAQWCDWPYLRHGGEAVQGRLIEALIGGLAGLATMYPALRVKQVSLFREVRAPKAATWWEHVGSEHRRAITLPHTTDPVHAWCTFSTRPGKRQQILYISTPIARDGGILPCWQPWFDTLTPDALIFCAPELFDEDIPAERRVATRFLGTLRDGGIAVYDTPNFFVLPEHLVVRDQSIPGLPSPGIDVEGYLHAKFGYGVGALLYLLAPVSG